MLRLAVASLAAVSVAASPITQQAVADWGMFSDSVTSDADWLNHTAVRVSVASSKARVTQALQHVLSAARATDVWRMDAAAAHVDFVVPSAELERVGSIKGVGKVEVLEADVGMQLLKHAEERRHAKPWNAERPLVEFFDNWRTLEECELFALALVAEHPDRATFLPNIGTSAEGRPIFVVEMGGTLGEQAPAIYLQGTLHAREWISTSTTLYILHQLITSEDPRVRSLVQNLRIVIAPITNPDGYHHTWNGNRMWRKNRQVNPGSTCIGVDLNRNWEDGHWSGPGSSSNPCSDTYHGPAGMSEPETQAVERYLMQTLPAQGYTLVGAIDYHSYGQLILRPYGWTFPSQQLPPNDEDLTRVGDGMADAMLASGGARYLSQYAAELYVASGGCDDWLYTNATQSTGFAYTYELPPVGANPGFQPPASVIRPSGQDNVVGALWFAEQMLAKFAK